MILKLTLTVAALRAALTAPATGRHRRPRWPARIATAAREYARFILGIPDTGQHYRPAHAARSPRLMALLPCLYQPTQYSPARAVRTRQT